MTISSADSITVVAGGTKQFMATPSREVTWRVERAEGPKFPLAAAPNGRSLVDSDGVPFRVHGDTAWSLVANLSLPEIELYLADRKARGFNAILVNLLEHRFAANAPANRAGEFPFASHERGSYDFSQPNPAYFSLVDAALDKAAAAGFAVLLSPMYLGAGGGDEGWWTELTNAKNTEAACLAYGRFLGARYKDKTNIIWVMSGDYTPPASSEGEKRLIRIYEGIREAGAKQMTTAHCSPDHNSDDWSAFRPSLQLIGAYGYGANTHQNGLLAYSHQPAKPAFYLEGGYEAEDHVAGDPASIRMYAWWGQLTTIGGGFYGHRDIWPFHSATWNNGYSFGHAPWTDALDAPGARAMGHMASLLSTVAWNKLVPSGASTQKQLVAAGAGDPSSVVTAAADPEGSLLMAYVPHAHRGSITIDMTALSGSVRARWWDPTSGTFTEVGELPNAGKQTFNRPGPNAAGDLDWLLLIDRGLGPSCGSIDEAGFYTAPPVPPSPPTCAITATDNANPRVVARNVITITPS